MSEVKFMITHSNPDSYYEIRRTRPDNTLSVDPHRARVHSTHATNIWPAFQRAFQQSGLPTHQLEMNRGRLTRDTWYVLSDAAGARLALTMQLSNTTTDQTKLNKMTQAINELTDEQAIATYEHYFYGKITDETLATIRRIKHQMTEVTA